MGINHEHEMHSAPVGADENAILASGSIGDAASPETETAEIMLDVTGMHCASCVGTVVKALCAVPGVKSAEVNLITGTAKVDVAGPPRADALIDAVKRVGYGSRLAKPLSRLAVIPSSTGGGTTAAQQAEHQGEAAKESHAHPYGAPDHQAAAHQASDHQASAHQASAHEAVHHDMPHQGEHQEDHAVRHHHKHDHGDGMHEHDISLRISELGQAAVLTVLITLVSTLWRGHPVWVDGLIGLVAAGIVFWYGRQIMNAAWRSVIHARPGMDTLIGLGSVAALAAGVFELFRPMGGMTDFVTAAVIMLFQLIGRGLEGKARRKMVSAVEALLSHVPATAVRVTEAGEETTAVANIRPDDILIVRPGEAVPTDGLVIEGETHVDESMLTGEPIPVDKSSGAKVWQGTLNGPGMIRMKAVTSGEAAAVGRIAEAVKRAQGSKVPMQRLADRVTAWFVPTILVIALLAFAVYFSFGSGWHAFEAAVAVLVVACPCALGLAIPAAAAVGSGKAAEMGTLFRDAAALEAASSIGMVAFDKTGTLTLGKPELTDAVLSEGVGEPALARIAAAEEGSEHPVGKAVRAGLAARLAGQELPKANAFRAHGGRGIEAEVEGRRMLIGTEAFLSANGIQVPESVRSPLAALQAEGKTTVLAAEDGTVMAVLAVADTLRPEAASAVNALKRLGIGSAMITGDVELAAKAAATKVGIENVSWQVPPEGKAARITELQKQVPGGARLAMVGDGVNDGPALAQADIGVAMGSGTDAALGAASVTLLRNDLMAIPAAVELSRATKRIMIGNLYWAFGYNIVMIPFALTGHLSPMIASAAMALSGITVVLNALRLKRFRPVKQ